MLTLELPYPPTMNTYWRNIGKGRTIISKRGRDFRKAVMEHVMPMRIVPQPGRLSVWVYATMPDRRKRDIDNILKPLIDSLAHAAVFANDEQIDALHVLRCGIEPPGNVIVTISPFLMEGA